MLALVALSISSASAATGFYNYSYLDFGTAQTTHESQVGLKFTGPLSLALDGELVRQSVNQSSKTGFEGGVTVPLVKLGSMTSAARLGYGQIENSKYYSVSADVTLPISSSVGLFANVRHRNGISRDVPSAVNRVAVGFDAKLAKNLSARIGYEAERINRVNGQGVVLSLNYSL